MVADAALMKSVFWITLLFSINLCNYFDRFTIAGILPSVQHTFDINDASAGFLQTIFVIFYTAVAPLFGFLADHFNRKQIIVVGLAAWTAVTLASSFIDGTQFWWFLLLRGASGVGEASYSVCAPTIIADAVALNWRSRALMIFYFAIPIGSGLGYAFGSQLASALGNWRWALRLAPAVGVLNILALVACVAEPRENSDSQCTVVSVVDAVADVDSGLVAVAASSPPPEKRASLCGLCRTYVSDLRYLLGIKSYLWLAVGYTSMMFHVGAVAWWIPAIYMHATAMNQRLNTTLEISAGDEHFITLMFGAITCVGGLIGISGGVLLARAWKRGACCFAGCATLKADALTSAIGSLGAFPFFVLTFTAISTYPTLCWALIYMGFALLCLNWAICVDMIMYIVVPRHQNVANALFFTVSHLFGDAAGPYAVGQIADWVREGDTATPSASYAAFCRTFYAVNALLVLSGVAFIMAACTSTRDMSAVDRAAAATPNSTGTRRTKA